MIDLTNTCYYCGAETDLVEVEDRDESSGYHGVQYICLLCVELYERRYAEA